MFPKSAALIDVLQIARLNINSEITLWNMIELFRQPDIAFTPVDLHRNKALGDGIRDVIQGIFDVRNIGQHIL